MAQKTGSVDGFSSESCSGSCYHQISQHDLAHRLAVHHEKKILVRCACEVSLLTHRVCSDLNLIVVENVQNCHEVEPH